MKKIGYFLVALLAFSCLFVFVGCEGDGPAVDEVGSWVLTHAASCEVEGEESFVDFDGNVLYTRAVQATGHEWEDWQITTPATCLSAGVKTRVCTTCGNNDVASIAQLNHDFAEYITIKEPTCTLAGIEQSVCSHDQSHVHQRPLAATGHDFSEFVLETAPTCTAVGGEIRICRNDNSHVERREIAALGHDFGPWLDISEQTETTDAVQQRMCCNNSGHIESKTLSLATGTNGLKYKLNADGQGYTVTGMGSTSSSGTLYIPLYHNDLPITRIGEEAFLYYNLGIRFDSLVFASGSYVTHIEKGAFWAISKITTLNLPERLVEIGESAFAQAALSELTFPKTLKIIGASAFKSIKVKSLVFPNSVEYIGEEAFGYNYDLKSVELSPLIQTLAPTAFKGSTRIESLSVRGMGEKYASQDNCIIDVLAKTVVLGCKTSIIPSFVQHIGDYAFFKQDFGSSEFALHDGLLSIGAYAFAESTLIRLKLPSELVSIGENAFAFCSLLQSIELSEKIERIGEQAFAALGRLNSVSGGGGKYISVQNCIMEAETSKLLTSAGEIPANTKIIAGYAFYTKTVEENLSLPSGLKIIGENAFANTNVVSITIPASVERIENGGFGANLYLTDIIFEENSRLEYIGEFAFFSSLITSLTIPASVQVIDVYAFGFTPLKTLTFEQGSMLRIIGECAFNYTEIEHVLIPASVEEIHLMAFDSVPLKTIAFEQNSQLKRIEAFAFYRTQATEITLPSTIEIIESLAFGGDIIQIITVNLTEKPEGWQDYWQGEAFVQWQTPQA